MSAMKLYIGDSVYADLDEWGRLVLTTSNGLYDNNIIILEPEVIRGMLRFMDAKNLLPEEYHGR